MDKSESNNTRYPPFSCPGTLGDKILHGVVGEELLELGIELRRQGFIVGDDQRGLVQRLNHICHGERLAGASDAQQRLKLIAFFEALDQLGDGLGLIAGGGVLGY